MDVTPYVQQLRDDMLAASAVGDEQIRRAAAMLTTALEPAARLAMMSALSELAAEVTGALGDTTVTVRLDGPELRVNVDRHGQTPPAGDGWAAPGAADGGEGDDDDDDESDLGRAVRDAGEELSRTTLRLVNNLKTQAERAASAQGVSLNTYIQRAVADAVRAAGARGRRHGHGPNTVTGFVQG